jgi:hypothetical protein
MTPERARGRAAFLLYAAIQFVVLTAIAMQLYAGGTAWDPASSGYAFAHNFFSDLGATHAWSGHANHASAALFAIALVTLGVAFIAFAGTWRVFAFERARARAAGIAAQVAGTLSGASFIAVAAAPIDISMRLHNTFVVAAFGLLLGYAAFLTVLLWRNGATRALLAAGIVYVVLVTVYVALVVYAVRGGVASERGFELMVVSQKVMAYSSMVFVMFLTTTTRRQCAAAS